MVRGTKNNISPKLINEYFNIENYPKDEYSALLESPVDTMAITTILTGYEDDAEGDWMKIPREFFTMHANPWYYFVCARIMPFTLNSTATKKKTLLTYTIPKGMTINVGKIINEEIHALVNLRTSTQALGFSHLIFGLCLKEGVLCSINPLDKVAPQAILKLAAFEAAQERKKKDKKATISLYRNERGAGSSSLSQICSQIDEIKAQVEANLGETKDALYNSQDELREFMFYQMAFNEHMAMKNGVDSYLGYPLSHLLLPPFPPPP